MSSLDKFVKYDNCYGNSRYYASRKRIIDNAFENARFECIRVDIRNMHRIYVETKINGYTTYWKLDEFLKLNDTICSEQQEFIKKQNLENKVSAYTKQLKTVYEIISNNKTGWLFFRKKSEVDNVNLYIQFEGTRNTRIFLAAYEYSTYIQARANKELNEHLLSIVLRDGYYNNKNNYKSRDTNFNQEIICYY